MNLHSKSIARYLFLVLFTLLVLPSTLLAQTEKGLDDTINEAVEPLTAFVESIVFFTVPITSEIDVPFVLILFSLEPFSVRFILDFLICDTLEQVLILFAVNMMIQTM